MVNMTIGLNIFNRLTQPTIFYKSDNVNWLDVYACDGSYTDGFLEIDLFDETNSLSLNLSNSPSL